MLTGTSREGDCNQLVMNVHRSGGAAVSLGARIQAEETVLGDCSYSEPLGLGSPVTQAVEPAGTNAVAYPAALCEESSLIISRLVIGEDHLKVQRSTWGK